MTLPPEFPLPLKDDRSRPGWRVLEQPFAFLSYSKGEIVVPAGFDTDYASIPRIFWSIYPPDGSYAPAAVVHDWLYWSQDFTRDESDRVFYEAMTALGVPWLRRQIIYRAVRLGGWAPWGKRARQILTEYEPTESP